MNSKLHNVRSIDDQRIVYEHILLHCMPLSNPFFRDKLNRKLTQVGCIYSQLKVLTERY